MALRDRSLDEKIITAARDEFSEKGYSGASLRKITERAGATVGAIQTRYKSKNDLFGRLLKPLLDEIEVLFQNTKAEYYSSTDGEFLTGLKASMQRESRSFILFLTITMRRCCFCAAALEAALNIILTGRFSVK